MDKRELVQKMKEKAEAVQAKVSDVSELGDIFRYTVDLTKAQGGSTIAAPDLSEADRGVLWGLCEEAGITLLTPPFTGNLEKIHTGLTAAQRGIAETGTLLVASASEDVRVASMLSETHVAVLREDAVLADTDALEEEMDKMLKGDANYLAFITGPSRTADIERVLSIGVHGPKELHILMMEENR